MTKVTPVSIFTLAFLCVALLCCSCTRIAPNERGHIAAGIVSQSMNVKSLPLWQLEPCKSNGDCADPFICLDQTFICENPPCNENCFPKVSLCNCDVPCSGIFERLQCFQSKQNGEFISNICLNPDDGSIDLIATLGEKESACLKGYSR